MQLSSGDPVFIVARVLGKIRRAHFGQLRVGTLPESLNTQSKIFGNGLEVAADIDTREVGRRWIDSLNVQVEIAALVVVLQLNHVLPGLLRKLATPCQDISGEDDIKN